MRTRRNRSLRKSADLESLLRDDDSLPAAPAAPADRGLGLPPVHPAEESSSLFCIFGGIKRAGSWEPPENLQVYALFGGAELDFNEAELLEGTTEVEIFALFGGITIRVPDDIHVDCDGVGIFGGFDHHGHRADDEGAPELRIRGYALFGGVTVKGPKRKRWLKRRR